METGNLHDAHHGSGTFVPSIILYTCSWLFIYLETLSPDAIWTWAFRALSAISLLLIIYINWAKAKEIFKSKKKNHDKD
jgi:hypothetical protein